MVISNRQARGFTLVEILVVVLIASIVMAVMLSVLGSSFEILRAGETKVKLNAEARTAIDYICRDIESAAYIPLCDDRDLNGFDDKTQDTSLGYGEDAVWRNAWRDSDDIPVIAASFFLTEAWSDRIMLEHNTKQFYDLDNSGRLLPITRRHVSPISNIGGGVNDPAFYRSFFRLALPVAPSDPASGNAADMPYYLLRPENVFLGSTPPGRVYGYPDSVSAGPHKETAALMLDRFNTFVNDYVVQSKPSRASRVPIASNITRVKFEYLHEVPVYISRVNGGDVEVAYQVADEINWRSQFWRQTDVTDGEMPIISHWEMRQIDVAHDEDTSDPITGATYAGTHWMLADQYPEGWDDNKLDGSDSNLFSPPDVGTGMGFGEATASGGIGTGWNCSAFWNTSTSPGGIADNAPIDRFAYVTNSISGGLGVSGGLAALRPDMSARGTEYIAYAEDPTGIGDFGDADGIPDGDGIPDDPVPGWWMPYVGAIRVTVVATPEKVMRQRIEQSGQPGKLGAVVYYRLDSPVPYSDPARTIPLENQRQDYIGAGKDLVLTRTVPVTFSYSRKLLWDPTSTESNAFDGRRVDINVQRASFILNYEPVTPGSLEAPANPVVRLREIENLN